MAGKGKRIRDGVIPRAEKPRFGATAPYAPAPSDMAHSNEEDRVALLTFLYSSPPYFRVLIKNFNLSPFLDLPSPSHKSV